MTIASQSASSTTAYAPTGLETDPQVQLELIRKFRDEVRELSQLDGSGKDGFDREYELLLLVDQQMKESDTGFFSAKQDANNMKNRYADVLPNEETMCKVSGVSESDSYFNGNYVCPPGNYHQYICCQAPMKSTLGDFWNVLWYYGSRVVVMLCEEVENGRSKSDRYWPNAVGEKGRYSHFDVLWTNEKHTPGCIVRNYVVTNLLNGETRSVVHFQFIGWPDFGVPPESKGLRQMIKSIDVETTIDQSEGETRPIVCHCSAGIGRTGTFIAAHTALAHYLHGVKWDMFEIAKCLKQQRCGMIQRREQYRFAFDAVMEELEQCAPTLQRFVQPPPQISDLPDTVVCQVPAVPPATVIPVHNPPVNVAPSPATHLGHSVQPPPMAPQPQIIRAPPPPPQQPPPQNMNPQQPVQLHPPLQLPIPQGPPMHHNHNGPQQVPSPGSTVVQPPPSPHHPHAHMQSPVMSVQAQHPPHPASPHPPLPSHPQQAPSPPYQHQQRTLTPPLRPPTDDRARSNMSPQLPQYDIPSGPPHPHSHPQPHPHPRGPQSAAYPRAVRPNSHNQGSYNPGGARRPQPQGMLI
eukprot:TRINITY_DN64617_c0_g1_i1.p1 TRINITY_DN64617_c0_g1~~TRINITY_DN64617_c0_g1_i1.p1  ORF type:complete len:601 (+),score=30.77 TRINITY_DN64617_c0_g1_i1:74-1804(+)